MKTFGLSIMLGFLFLPTIVAAEEITTIPTELAQQLAVKIAEQAGKIEKLKFKIDPDSDKANGFHVPKKLGALIVPQKDLKEGKELAAKFKMDPGASLAYLFVHHVVPMVDGKRIESDRLPSVTIADDDGKEHVVHVLLLSARQLSEDDYRLYVFGKDGKQLVDAKFAEGTGPGPVPVAVELKNPNEATREGTIVVTVFGKFQASFPAGYTGE